MNDLKDEIQELPENETEIEKPYEIIDIAENQDGHGLKILAPNQMLNILPISLTQLKAGSNSEGLTNGIRQLLYSLYRSKKLSKTIYNNLIDTI